MTGTQTAATVDLGADTRLALRRMAKSVAVISCRHEGQRFAMAATAVSELSMDPPSMLIAVNRSASMHRPLTAGAPFAINILASSQAEISRRCGGGLRGEERFQLGTWADTPEGVPILADAQANIICRQDGALPYGTHVVYVGRVTEVQLHGDIDPLIYLDGRYTAAVRTAS